MASIFAWYFVRLVLEAEIMTRKDYILLAEALNEALGYVIEPDETEGVIHAVEFIARALAKDNPRFDRDHFLAVAHGYRALDSRPPR